MSEITSNLFDTFLPVVLTLNVLLGYNKEWKLVSEDTEMAFYVNYISHALVRTFLAMTFCIGFRLLLSRWLCVRSYSFFLTVASDVSSCAVAHVLPTSFILAVIVLLGYAVMGFRFIYDVIITGHGLKWLMSNTEYFIKKYEVEKEERYELQSSCSDSNVLHLYRKL